MTSLTLLDFTFDYKKIWLHKTKFFCQTLRLIWKTVAYKVSVKRDGHSSDMFCTAGASFTISCLTSGNIWSISVRYLAVSSSFHLQWLSLHFQRFRKVEQIICFTSFWSVDILAWVVFLWVAFTLFTPINCYIFTSNFSKLCNIVRHLKFKSFLPVIPSQL